MKSMKTALMVLLVLTGGLASESVLAHGPRVHFGIGVGFPGFWPGYYPPYYPSYPSYPSYYYPPVVTAPAAPPVYVEQGTSQAAPAPAQANNNWWYYCAESQAYYPYVKQCAAGWQRVAPQPAS
jgi:hypothetical protein